MTTALPRISRENMKFEDFEILKTPGACARGCIFPALPFFLFVF